MTFNEHAEMCAMYPYSDECYQIVKECKEIQLQEFWLRQKQALFERACVGGEGLFCEAAALIDQEQIQVVEESVGKAIGNVIDKIFKGIKNLFKTIGKFFSNVKKTLFGGSSSNKKKKKTKHLGDYDIQLDDDTGDPTSKLEGILKINSFSQTGPLGITPAARQPIPKDFKFPIAKGGHSLSQEMKILYYIAMGDGPLVLDLHGSSVDMVISTSEFEKISKEFSGITGPGMFGGKVARINKLINRKRSSVTIEITEEMMNDLASEFTRLSMTLHLNDAVPAKGIDGNGFNAKETTLLHESFSRFMAMWAKTMAVYNSVVVYKTQARKRIRKWLNKYSSN